MQALTGGIPSRVPSQAASLTGALLASLIALSPASSSAQPGAQAPRFKMVVLHELGTAGNPDQHKPYVDACKIWLSQLAKDSNFTVTYQENPDNFTDAFLEDVAIVFQMNYPPFGWKAAAATAFQKWMESGKGSWVGVHHASLYGPRITPQTWPWFQKLLGGINYNAYISKFASGDVVVEQASHPIFAGVPAKFNVSTEEWYTYDKTPRPNVKVLANLDEASMKFQDASQSGTKMGDHPVVWTYEGYKGRNLYIFMGHHPNLIQNTAYTSLLRNSLIWAANKPVATGIAKDGAKWEGKPGRAARGSDGHTVIFTSPAELKGGRPDVPRKADGRRAGPGITR